MNNLLAGLLGVILAVGACFAAKWYLRNGR